MVEQKIYEEIHDQILQGSSKDAILNNFNLDNLSQSEAKAILSFIDTRIMELELAKQSKSKMFNKMILGAFLLLLGLFITIGTFLAGFSKFIITFGAIGFGAWFLKDGYKKYNLPIEEHFPRSQRIKNSRFKNK